MERTINISEDVAIAEEIRLIMEQMGVHEDNMHQLREFLCEFSSKYFGRDVCPSESLESILVPIIFGLIFVIGLIGNIIVILRGLLFLISVEKKQSNRSQIISQNHRHKANRVYVLSLAVSDMIFILFCVPFQAFIYTFPTWFFGRFLCKFCSRLLIYN
ncbi:unnamed protein product [Oikopleura dioica]|uniref:G-protein coupled receptors family 1 profile domain-containing protein n=1 Tax=Oikopleura dioica TaxID=34765 RepID=E4YQ01_OIKDI|nr:unnamed protein product [Oikopleura dioica]